MHQRLSFEHENECRAVIWGIGAVQWPEGLPDHILNTFPVGISVAIELPKLINCVVVAPSAPGWFCDTVANVTEIYGQKFPVKQSSLAIAPYL